MKDRFPPTETAPASARKREPEQSLETDPCKSYQPVEVRPADAMKSLLVDLPECR
jgi:hypothetical protein